MNNRVFGIKECKNCGKQYVPTGSCQKYRADCRREMDLQRMRDGHKRRYVRKGYNQSGDNNNKFKAGTGSGRKTWVYEKFRKDSCEYCSATTQDVRRLVVHHRDGDHTNNDPCNLVTLCDTCHKLVHNGKIEV